MMRTIEGSQLSLPSEVRPDEIYREKTLGSAIELCAKAGGYQLDKDLQIAMKVDKGQFSRWQSGTEGVMWPKFVKLMDFCGNDAPVMWMLHQRGYDLHTVRRIESTVERENRLLREENLALRRVLIGGGGNG